MVRGPAALLTAVAGALLIWLAPVLPEIGGGAGDAATLIAGGTGLLAVAACAAVAVPAITARAVLVAALPAAAILVAAATVAGAGPAASPIEALAYGVAGTAFAALLDSAALALALPVFVAVVDAVSVANGGSGGLQLDRFATSADPLALALPAWGSGATVARLSAAVVLFLAAFGAYATRFRLRAQATVVALAAALVLALVLDVALDASMPVLSLLAASYLAVNADRLGALARAARGG